jgi:hypothetical protein
MRRDRNQLRGKPCSDPVAAAVDGDIRISKLVQ